MISPLQEERLKYHPPLPHLLRSLNAIDVSEGERADRQDAIKEFLPKTSVQPLLHFRRGSFKEHPPLRVGVLLSGGQAAGGHNVITGLFDALKELNPSCRLFGFLDGPAGIIENRYCELSEELLAGYRNTGGFDLIGSGRTKIESAEQFESARQNALELNLHGLVIIGGDDSNTNAALLAEFFLTHHTPARVIGVPKTIDGDLKSAHIETSFGFDTACKIYSALIGNIARDALSAKKYYHFIKLMGRSASHVTLECALQTHPNIALIGEERWSLERIVTYITETISLRAQGGKNYGVILIPEGLIESIPEAQKRGDLDPHGNLPLSHIATEQLLIDMVKKRVKGKFSPVNHFFGYEGRSSFPSNFDATYCYSLGRAAAVLIGSGHTGYMSVIHHLTEPVEKWEAGGVPLTLLMTMEERRGKLKPVIQKALVDLKGEPFKRFSQERERWRLDDHYRYPGPLQLFGPPSLTDETTFTLKLEQRSKICI